MEEKFFDESSKFLNNLKKGKALLISKKDDKINVMQIGWGFIGYMWKKPSIIVAVRHSRYTYELLKKSDEFVVSIPKDDEFDEKLKICGTKSGRDTDKIKECGFEMENSEKISVPYINGCQYNYECRIKYKQSLDSELINDDLIDGSYKNNDYHVMIYGEILSAHK